MSLPVHQAPRIPGGSAPRPGRIAGAGPLAGAAPPGFPSHEARREPEPLRGAPSSAAVRITGSRQGFAQARTFTHRTLCRWSLDHLSDDAAVVVTELAANAVTHAVPQAPDGEADVWLELCLEAGHLMCAVTDPSDRPPVYPRATGSLEENGRGLRIVEAVSEDWGWVRHSPAGKTVWALLPATPRP